MSTYGRNFEFRVQPHSGDRSGRFINPVGGAAIPMGAPARVDETAGSDVEGRLPVGLATGASPNPQPGLAGIPLYEWAPVAFAGDDPLLVSYSDKDTVPVGAPCYVVSGTQVKVVLRNSDKLGGNFPSFFGQRTYSTRKMVAGIGQATPSVKVGDMLRPHDSPSDSNGYWQETSTAAEAWLVVTHVDNTRGEVEARFLF